MDTLKLKPGDFMKNAGIVGFQRMMEIYCRKQGRYFDSSRDEYPVEELRELDLAQMYIDAFVEVYGEQTTVGVALKKLDKWIEKLEKQEEKFDTEKFKTDWNFIHRKITSPCCMSGYEGIEDLVSGGKIFKEKIKVPGKKSDLAVVLPELLVKLKQLQNFFCQEPLVHNTFLFKSIMYSVIKQFWTGRWIFHKDKVKLSIRKVLEGDIIKPFIKFLSRECEIPPKVKNSYDCIDCGKFIATSKPGSSVSKGSSEKIWGQNIGFLVDMADDLERKTSAFWNCNPDAFVCPICTFLYTLAPLGFVQVENGDFLFINSNSSVASLYVNNRSKVGGGEVPSYQQRLNQAIQQILEGKEKIASGIQVITRSSKENKYHFSVIDRELVGLLTAVKTPLEFLSRVPLIKLSRKGDGKKTYLNMYQECILNILNYRNQYNLLNRLILESIKKDRKQPLKWFDILFKLLTVQTQQLISQKENNPMDLKKQQDLAAKSGSELRNLLVSLKRGENAANLTEEKKEDILRGTVYQLTNALKLKNTEQFMDLIIRIYSSCKKPVPKKVFLAALRDTDAFALIGYAFVIGLKGGFYDKNSKNQTSDSLPEGE